MEVLKGTQSSFETFSYIIDLALLIFLEGGSLTTFFFFFTNLLVRVKLGYPQNFNFPGKPLLGEKYVEGKKKEERKKKEE